MVSRPIPVVFDSKLHWKIEKYEELNLLVMTHPESPADDPGFGMLIEFFRAEAEPWRWDTLFNMKPWPGYTPFPIIVDFAEKWYDLVGERDLHRRVASIDDNPVTTSRYATESFQKIFPTREFKLFDQLEDGIEWITRPRPEVAIDLPYFASKVAE
jgi:hypothetical protein